MKISTILNDGRRHLSFEVFPPKDSTRFESVKNATQKVAELDPSFVSVTYGAGGGTSAYTIDIASNVMESCGVPSLAHITCVYSTKETVKKQIEAIHAAGIENVMALRGDIPAEGCSISDYTHAVELVRELKESSYDFCIGGACYPEVHPESRTQEEDLKYLKEKADAGCDFLTTQMFFDNNLFYNFLFKAREAGISIPIIPGIMPITRANQVERAIKLSGSFMPRRFISIVDRFGDDPEAMEQAGIAYAVDQIIDLYANGIRNIHVYSMNKPHVAAKIMENMSAIVSPGR